MMLMINDIKDHDDDNADDDKHDDDDAFDAWVFRDVTWDTCPECSNAPFLKRWNCDFFLTNFRFFKEGFPYKG